MFFDLRLQIIPIFRDNLQSIFPIKKRFHRTRDFFQNGLRQLCVHRQRKDGRAKLFGYGQFHAIPVLTESRLVVERDGVVNHHRDALFAKMCLQVIAGRARVGRGNL
jgi:hypothetical protein